jgi:hypothetical protein
VSWFWALVLLVIFAWTMLPGGLAAIAWSLGFHIGRRLSKHAFTNPTGDGDGS